MLLDNCCWEARKLQTASLVSKQPLSPATVRCVDPWDVGDVVDVVFWVHSVDKIHGDVMCEVQVPWNKQPHFVRTLPMGFFRVTQGLLAQQAAQDSGYKSGAQK